MHRTNLCIVPLLCAALTPWLSACVGDGAVLLHTSANVDYDEHDPDGTSTTTGALDPATSDPAPGTGEDSSATTSQPLIFDVGSPHASPGDAFIPSTCDLSYQAKSSMGWL